MVIQIARWQWHYGNFLENDGILFPDILHLFTNAFELISAVENDRNTWTSATGL